MRLLRAGTNWKEVAQFDCSTPPRTMCLPLGRSYSIVKK